jgi:hypothetical protein
MKLIDSKGQRLYLTPRTSVLIHIKKEHDNLLTMPLKNFGHKMVTTFRITSLVTYHNSLSDNMGDTGLEPVTPCLSSKRNK